MRYDYCIIGGGIVGAATARAILRRRPDAAVLLLEKESRLGAHQTGHNSGVIHAGIYYEPGSLKAELCREGARATKDLCDEHGIPYRTCGKLLVATNDLELARMADLQERARINGIKAELLHADELRDREPRISGLGALFVKETGIVDYTQVVQQIGKLVESAGAVVRLGVTVTGIAEQDDHVRVSTDAGVFESRQLVVCAGLQADRMAKLAGLTIDAQIIPFRGEYFRLPEHRNDLVQHLIYPIPDPALPFLGVHLSPTIHGRVTVGPNAVLGLAREGYPKSAWRSRDVRQLAAYPGMWRLARKYWRTGLVEVRNSAWRRGYLKACQKYCPELTLDDLQPMEAGIRAQAVNRTGTLVHDFLFSESPRSLHVLNAPSPAATSAVPIGNMIATKVIARSS